MDIKIIELLSEEIRETRRLAIAAEKTATAAQKTADATWEEVKETRKLALSAERKADAAWELVVMTHNEIQINLANLRLPWWKKLLGQTG